MEEKILSLLMEMNTKIERLTEQGNELKEEIKQVNIRLDRVEARLGRVEARLGRVEARLDCVEDEVKQMNTRLSRVEEEVQQMNTRLDRHEEKLDTIYKMAADNRGDITELRLQIDSLTTTVEIASETFQSNIEYLMRANLAKREIFLCSW